MRIQVLKARINTQRTMSALAYGLNYDKIAKHTSDRVRIRVLKGTYHQLPVFVGILNGEFRFFDI